MAEVGLTQVIVGVGFLAVLIAVQIGLRRHAGLLGGALSRKRSDCGDGERASLIRRPTPSHRGAGAVFSFFHHPQWLSGL